MARDTVTLLPEAILVAGAVGCLLLGSFTPRLQQGRVRLAAALVALTAGIVSGVALLGDSTSAFSGTFVADGLTGVLRLTVCLGLLVLLGLAREVRGHPRESEVAVLMLFGAAGVMLMGGVQDTAVLLVAFFLASIPLYGLVGLSSDARAPEAAVKTYLVGALCGIFMMLGAAVLLGLVGDTAYASLARLADTERAPAAAAVGGVALLLTGLLFKAGAVPAHLWVPDATQGSWVTTAAFLTTLPKLGAIAAVARLVMALPDQHRWPLLVAVIAAATMMVGNLAALGQSDVRRLLAWSTVSQAGYLLAAAAAVRSPALGEGLGVATVTVFLAAYAVTNLGAFAVVAALPRLRDVDDWRGAARAHPLLVAALVVSLLGLVGTPPTAIFVAKLAVLSTTWGAGLQWLAVLVAANTVLSLAYYLRWVGACLRSRDDDGGMPGRLPVETRLAAGCAAAAVLLGVAAGPLLASVR